MKHWILSALCALLASAMAMASDQSPQAGATAARAADAAGQAAPLYTVEQGSKVDAQTLAGWKTWRGLACERCHGANQEGLVGPSLIESMKRLTKEEFHLTVMNGRIEKGMPPFRSSKMVNENWQGLYAYLKGRSDGRIQPGRLSPLDPQ